MIIDIQGGVKIYEKTKNYKFLFIEVSDLDDLEKRFRKSGKYTEDQIKTMMETAKNEKE